MAILNTDLITYEYYKNRLFLDKIPNESEFNRYKVLNIAYITRYLPYITEIMKNGVINSVSYMIEHDYLTDIQRLELITDKMLSSESIGSVSQSYENSHYNKLVELNTVDTDKAKLKLIKLFNNINLGIGQ